jgi:NADH-quinone oxidoreductase subunit C
MAIKIVAETVTPRGVRMLRLQPAKLVPAAEVEAAIKEVLQGLNATTTISYDEAVVTVSPEHLVEAAQRLRDHPKLRMTYPRCVAAVDYPDQGEIEVTYWLYSPELSQKAALKVRCPRDGGAVPSLVSVWRGVDWHEREQAEMFGIRFEGHPNLKPLLLQADFPGPVLRKDFPIREPQSPPVRKAGGEQLEEEAAE